MRITVERSGGVANVRRTVTVDAEALAADRAVELRRLVDAAELATFPENPTPLSGRPDRFIYRLTVEEEGGVRAVTVSEDSASEGMQRLLDWVQATAEG